jgi:hypothetical protein
MVLPYNKVKHLDNLWVSPPGVVPQNEQQPRTIVDYLFSGVNQETLRLAPPNVMQFSRGDEHFLRKIVHADPRFGPVKTLKVDMSDGFYRVGVRIRDIPKFGIAFPLLDEEEPLIAIPLCLPMGWAKSPPYFCPTTKTVADITNERILKWHHPTLHKLEKQSATPPAAATDCSLVTPHEPLTSLPLSRDPLIGHCSWMLAYINVFVNDLISCAQGDQGRLKHVQRILFHAVDDVFQPLDDANRPHRKERILVQKLLKGDPSWETCKTILDGS